MFSVWIRFFMSLVAETKNPFVLTRLKPLGRYMHVHLAPQCPVFGAPKQHDHANNNEMIFHDTDSPKNNNMKVFKVN